MRVRRTVPEASGRQVGWVILPWWWLAVASTTRGAGWGAGVGGAGIRDANVEGF